MNETYKLHEPYWHYSARTEQTQEKKYSAPMLVVKDNALVVVQKPST